MMLAGQIPRAFLPLGTGSGELIDGHVDARDPVGSIALHLPDRDADAVRGPRSVAERRQTPLLDQIFQQARVVEERVFDAAAHPWRDKEGRDPHTQAIEAVLRLMRI